MNIIDIAIAKQLAGGGGGSGTDSYNDLSNLPKINDVTLSGNKSSSALGLQSEITSDSKLASDLVDDTNQDNKFVTSAEKTTWNGKQNAIDADHKLNADYVDDSTSTNKFVTASDKEAWNAKQNAIDNSHKLSSDLVDDTNHTNKFVTSTEKQTWNAKQNAIDADHKLSSSLVSFSEAEAAALASGIDSAKVAQISTNQSNILYALKNGATNLLTTTAKSYSSGGITVTVDDRNKIVMSGSRSASSGITFNQDLVTGEDNYFNTRYTLPVGTYALYPESKEGFAIVLVAHNGSQMQSLAESTASSGANIFTYSAEIKAQYPYIAVMIWCGSSVSFASGGETFYLTVCDKVIWDTVGHDFMPPALPNYDLTRLESEDRASLAEVVDNGAKNLFDVPSSATIDTITWTADSDSYITASPNNTDTRGWGYNPSQYKFNLKAGTYVCVLDIKTASSQSGLGLAMYSSSDTNIFSSAISQIQNKTGMVTWKFTISAAGSYGIEFKCYNMIARIMICTKAAFCISPKFVPYKPTLGVVASLYRKATTATSETSTGLSATIPSTGIYRITASVWDAGVSVKASALTIKHSSGGSDYITSAAEPLSASARNVNCVVLVSFAGGEVVTLYGTWSAASQTSDCELVVEKIG